ncbi:GlgB N-terminal domain-containing protein, partial [Paenirhodobacter enshiensis]|uniref:GlgB N-terminal domain-containing protein n=1 Tax=Paenirhodobacter enshiensis TaxID=1105367 RepID=UPI003FA1B1F1
MPATDRSTAEAVARGRHSDPFSVLGLHDGWVTALIPDAERVWAVAGRTEVELFPVCPGVFCGAWDGGNYRLRASNAQVTWDFDDPYRFGPVLGAIDEYLIGEGTHRRLWEVLGAHVIAHEGIRGVHRAVCAPSALRVSVDGGLNNHDGRRHQMRRRGVTG